MTEKRGVCDGEGTAPAAPEAKEAAASPRPCCGTDPLSRMAEAVKEAEETKAQEGCGCSKT